MDICTSGHTPRSPSALAQHRGALVRLPPRAVHAVAQPPLAVVHTPVTIDSSWPNNGRLMPESHGATCGREPLYMCLYICTCSRVASSPRLWSAVWSSALADTHFRISSCGPGRQVTGLWPLASLRPMEGAILVRAAGGNTTEQGWGDCFHIRWLTQKSQLRPLAHQKQR